MSTYVLATGRNSALLFVCGENPNCTTLVHRLDRAKQFESPAEALAFRASMDSKSGRTADFIVHEYDGDLLHSLDV